MLADTLSLPPGARLGSLRVLGSCVKLSVMSGAQCSCMVTLFRGVAVGFCARKQLSLIQEIVGENREFHDLVMHIKMTACLACIVSGDRLLASWVRAGGA